MKNRKEMLGSRMQEATAQAKTLGNPVLSAIAFGSAIRNTGGASMDLNTRKFVNPGEEMYMVGGESTPTGEKVQEGKEPLIGGVEPSLTGIVNQMSRVSSETQKAPGVHLGAWNEDGNTVFDASRGYKSQAEALKLAKARGERAVYNAKTGEDIYTDQDEKK